MKTILAAGVVATALLAGCSTAGATDPSGSPSAGATTSATTLATPTLTSPKVQAEQAVVRFWKVRDEIARNPSEGVTKLAGVARGQALDLHRRILNTQATRGWKQVGNTVVTPIAAAPTATARKYTVTACVDVSKVDVVDGAGKSQVRPGRPERSAYDYTVERDGKQWFVVEDLLKGRSC